MLLLDSLYINNSGGLRLLEYLIAELNNRDVEFYLLADARCQGKFVDCRHIRYMHSSIRERNKFYKLKRNLFSSVICFGNVPPPFKLNVPVYTYFHNINLLTLRETHTIKEKAVSWLKREVFRHYKKNTDTWIVQTKNTAKELIKHLHEKENRVKILPFYDLSDRLLQTRAVLHGDDYVYIANYTGAKGHEELLDAWCLLHERGIDKTLHLTVPTTATRFIEKIDRARKMGVNVINHGFVPFDMVIDLYRQSKAIVYPSHNESLGLGIIEAISAGCDVIGADLPYIHAISKPSEVFNPYYAQSIAEAIERYEQQSCAKSELLTHNMIDELIDLITKNEGQRS